MGVVTDSIAVIGQQSALFVGRRTRTSLHRHHALEINICAAGSRIEAAAEGDAVVATEAGYLVGADVQHAVTSSRGPMVILYVDAEALRERWTASPLVELRHAPARAVGELVRDWIDADCPEGRAGSIVEESLAVLGVPVRPRAIDPRIARARDLIVDGGVPRRVEDIARSLGVSRSHLAELFTREIGIPPRAWRKWHRLCVGLLAAFDGASLTEAAHVSGFADSAHFSRTCRETFGLPPSRFVRIRRLRIARADAEP
jgi:AraC-like DNA-binding protein